MPTVAEAPAPTHPALADSAQNRWLPAQVAPLAPRSAQPLAGPARRSRHSLTDALRNVGRQTWERLSRLDVSCIQRKFSQAQRLQEVDDPHNLSVGNSSVCR